MNRQGRDGVTVTEPYYQDDWTTIYHGDCRDVLPTLPAVDLVFTSPPYNLSENGRRPSGTSWSRLDTGYASYADNLPRDEYVDWQRAVIRACWDKLTNTGAVYYQHKPLTRGNQLVMPFELVPPELPIRQVITWNKGPGVQRTYWHYNPSFEWVFVIAREDFRLNTLSLSDVWTITPEAGNQHPATFPLRLAKTAIASTDAPVVLDPFMGSGTTLRAAKDLNRRGIGIEINEAYCEIAAKRLAQEVLDLGA